MVLDPSCDYHAYLKSRVGLNFRITLCFNMYAVIFPTENDDKNNTTNVGLFAFFVNCFLVARQRTVCVILPKLH